MGPSGSEHLTDNILSDGHGLNEIISCLVGNLAHIELPVGVCLVAVGLAVGSFLNVVIYRVPRGISVVQPRSQCPTCNTPLRAWKLIPLVSYLLLRGRSECCGTSIRVRYPIVECLTAGAFTGVYAYSGISLTSLGLVLLYCLLITAAEIDREHRIIPNGLVLCGALIGLTFGLISALQAGQSAFTQVVLPTLVVTGLLLLVRSGSVLVWGKPGLGMGDVKLGAMLALFLGWTVLWVLYLAFVLSAVFGVVAILSKQMHRKANVPLAPFIAAACILQLLLPFGVVLQWLML